MDGWKYNNQALRTRQLNLKGNKITWLGHATCTRRARQIIYGPVVMGTLSPQAEKDVKQADAPFVRTATATTSGTPQRSQTAQVHGCGHLSCTWMQKKGVETIAPMNKGGPARREGHDGTCGALMRHSGGRWQIVYGGEACGYVLSAGRSDGVPRWRYCRVQRHGDNPRLVCFRGCELPIGGSFHHGAARSGLRRKLLQPKHVILMHFGTFPVLWEGRRNSELLGAGGRKWWRCKRGDGWPKKD
jgi:L-ascorbate metabolism protein UlaG (beta-lactamase superfamily)